MLQPHETSLVGRWVIQASGITKDEVCQRIESLVVSHLVALAKSPDGWSTLYRDPTDGRLWEHTYPQSELHGGGPPALLCLPHSAAKFLYGIET